MKIPCKEKTVDEVVGVFFIFGEYPDGTVDVNDGQRDVFTRLPRDVAEAVCKAQETYRFLLYSMLCGEVQDGPVR